MTRTFHALLLVLATSVHAVAAELAAPFPVAPECLRDGAVVQRSPAGCLGKSVYLVAWCDGSRQIHKPTADIYCGRIDAAIQPEPPAHADEYLLAPADVDDRVPGISRGVVRIERGANLDESPLRPRLGLGAGRP